MKREKGEGLGEFHGVGSLEGRGIMTVYLSKGADRFAGWVYRRQGERSESHSMPRERNMYSSIVISYGFWTVHIRCFVQQDAFPRRIAIHMYINW